MFEKIQNRLIEYRDLLELTLETLQNHIYTASIIIEETIKNNKKIYFFGDGKNSVIAQYISLNCGENLSSNSAILTEIASEYNFDKIYEKQIEQKVKSGDLLIGISTSGNNKRVLRGLSIGKTLGCKTIGFSGHDGGVMSEFCDINIVIPSEDSISINEMHMLISNMIFRNLV